MKKSLILLMLIVICIPIFFACNNTNTIWLATQEKIEEFFNGETDYSEFIDGNITFSSFLEIKRDELNSEFYDLTYYENILSSCFVNMSKHYGSFLIAPIKNQNSATYLCQKIDTDLANFITQIETFNTEKADFLTRTDSLQYNNNIAISKLNSFKLVFYDLILKANNLNQSFTNAYSTLYGETGATETPTSTSIFNKIGEVFADLINTYITYGFTEFDGNCKEGNDFYNQLLDLKTKIETRECNTTNFASWQIFYESFKSEKSIFLTALANIDLTADNESPSQLQQQYLNRIESFVNTNAGLFIGKTLTLFN